MRRQVEALGRAFISIADETGAVFLLFYATLRQMVRPPFEIKNIVKQMLEVGVMSVPVVLVTAIFTGMVLALQTYTGFKRFGAESVVGSVVAMSMTREMGPVLTGLIVTGRVGASMAAELGTMRVTEQIDALETLATNPIKYLVVPRFVACTFMMPALTVLADIIGILGGFMITVWLFGTSSSLYWRRTWEILQFEDIYNGLIKACFFGAAISLISCYKGFYTEGGAEGVGKATTGAVVMSFMAILVSNYFLAAWLYR